MRPRFPLRSLLLAAALAGASTAAAQSPPGTPAAREGLLAVQGGRIWYTVSGSGTGTPVVLVHCGPGCASFYLKPLESLGDARPVVRYDQLGSGKSDRISDTSLFTLDKYVRDLEALRAHLGYEQMHVLGHSTGTVIAVEYYRAHPSRVASLFLSGPVLDMPAYTRRVRRLARTLSASAQRAIRRREADGNFDAPDYQAAVAEFNARYMTSRRQVKADADSGDATFNMAMFRYMWGPSEFTVRGPLGRYDATPFLPRIAVPTLFQTGEFDLVGPELVRRYAATTPGARFELMPGVGHFSMRDAPDAMNRMVRRFLAAADAARAKR